MAWNLSGQYFESCNCDVLCPCITSQAQAAPTQGHCDFVIALQVESGEMEGTQLGGLNAVVMARAEGPMANLNTRGQMFIDERANEKQRAALEHLLSGKGGGAPAALAGFMPQFLGFKTAAITIEAEGTTHRLSIQGVGEQEVTALAGMGGETLVLTKTGHPVSDDLALARAGRAVFKDEHFTIDNTGKNGHFAPFRWSG